MLFTFAKCCHRNILRMKHENMLFSCVDLTIEYFLASKKVIGRLEIYFHRSRHLSTKIPPSHPTKKNNSILVIYARRRAYFTFLPSSPLRRYFSFLCKFLTQVCQNFPKENIDVSFWVEYTMQRTCATNILSNSLVILKFGIRVNETLPCIRALWNIQNSFSIVVSVILYNLYSSWNRFLIVFFVFFECELYYGLFFSNFFKICVIYVREKIRVVGFCFIQMEKVSITGLSFVLFSLE